MTCCSHRRDAGKFFDDKTARRELRRYDRKGPEKSTRLLLDALRDKDMQHKTLIDIGGGIGAISFELLEHGISESHHVDTSKAYLSVMQSETQKRDLDEKVSHQYGDFTELAFDTEPADIVTLDKVICCYPDMEKLVDCSAGKAKQFYGVAYPRDLPGANFAVSVVNLWFKIRRIDFRTYFHPPSKIDKRIVSNGFRKIYRDNTILWEVVLYERE